MNREACIPDEVKKDFVAVLKCLEADLTQQIFLLCGLDMIKCQRVSRLWRDTIGELMRDRAGRALILSEMGWTTCDVSKATFTVVPNQIPDKRIFIQCDKKDYIITPRIVILIQWVYSGTTESSRKRSALHPFNVDVQICDRKQLSTTYFRQTFETVLYKVHRKTTTFSTIHKDTLVFCWQCSDREDLVEMRSVSVCLGTYHVVKDERHLVERGFTHPWVEWQVLRTGRNDIKERIIQGLKDEQAKMFLKVDDSGYILTSKEEDDHAHSITVYDRDLKTIVQRSIHIPWQVSHMQYAHPIVLITLEGSAEVPGFYALWNVELSGQPAALWVCPIVSSPNIRFYGSCRLWSATHLSIGCTWSYFEKPRGPGEGPARVNQFALIPKDINIPSGNIAQPQLQSLRSHLLVSDLRSSPLRLQTSKGTTQLPYISSPRIDIRNFGPGLLFQEGEKEPTRCFNEDVFGPNSVSLVSPSLAMVVRGMNVHSLEDTFVDFRHPLF